MNDFYSTAFFVKHPFRIEDLKVPHRYETRKRFAVVKTIELSKIDYDNFVADLCVRTGKRPNTDGPESIQGLRVIWRLYDAEEKGIVADLRGLGLNRPWDRRGMDKNDCK
jgi:hypothetical protein